MGLGWIGLLSLKTAEELTQLEIGELVSIPAHRYFSQLLHHLIVCVHGLQRGAGSEVITIPHRSIHVPDGSQLRACQPFRALLLKILDTCTS